MTDDEQSLGEKKPELGQTALYSGFVLWHLALISALVLAVPGCQQAAPDAVPPTALADIEPQRLTSRGQLHFMQDVAAGRSLAEKKGLPCLLFFTADWCNYCHEMEETAFNDPVVTTMAERNFVCVLVDADREQEVCKQFSVSGYPTVQFVSAKGRVLNRLVGRQSSPELVSGMRAALKRFAWLNDPTTRVR